jgi:hypothetical protein
MDWWLLQGVPRAQTAQGLLSLPPSYRWRHNWTVIAAFLPNFKKTQNAVKP